jgi:hypothetical protein
MMSYVLNFSVKRSYRVTADGISIPFSLGRNDLVVFGEAKVDTGSEYCLFQRELAEELGIEVEEGSVVWLGTLAGAFTAHLHTVTLKTFEISFESTVLFTPGYGTNRNILGRRGWLNNLHLGLTMDDETIYLNPAYESENL